MIVLAIFAVMIALCLFIATQLTVKKNQRDRENLQRLVLETDWRREAESRLQQSQKMEALGRLTGGVAHDFNNLLAAILGGIQLATKRVSDQRTIGFLTMAADAAKRGAKLTEQMLAFSRKQDIVLHRFNANTLLTDMDDLLRRTTGGLIRISYELDENLWPIKADPVQLEVAILNLTVNARDAMPLGGDLVIATRNVVVGAEDGATSLPPGEYVQVSVSDTGEGMHDDVKNKAFEPFFTTKGPGKGTGLGLSTVFGFATQLGGTVTIRSTIGAGTTVAILIPRSAGDLPVEDKVPPAAPGTHTPIRILLVDDDQAVRELTAEMLEDLGHTVTTAARGRDALALLGADTCPFDVLMTDFAMPEMNGATLASEARKIHPALAILLTTGYAEVGTLDGWVQSGARTIAKPFTYEELGAVLQSMAPVAPATGDNVVTLRR